MSDGTAVWLNAASSLRFPTSFNGNERRVELTGEGYFEVTKNAAMPFKVLVDDMEVKVLGTHFNVNAYSDENDIKTTLLEGQVIVTNGREEAILKPGQQVQLLTDGRLKKINKVDLDAVMAWKTGLFSFKNADIKSVMSQLSNWYDVDVIYKNNYDDDRLFEGEIQKSLSLNQVLDLLSDNKIKYEIKDKVLIIK